MNKKPHVPSTPPYDTGKVKIGLLYLARPAPRRLTKSEEFLQGVLLMKARPSTMDRLRRLLR